jgi:hypothetical protein
MNFKPKTEKEIAEANNIPNGDYPFEVLNAVNDKSKAGNDMIKLTLRVFVGETGRQLDDYLLESMPGKLFHFCSYTGLAQKYDAGTLTADDCLGKSGFLTISTSKGKPKDDGSGDFWPDRPNVKDYIRNSGGVKAAVIAPKADAPGDSDVPY